MDGSTEVRSDTGSSISRWEFHKAEVVFFTQVVILYTVIVVSIYNLAAGSGDSNLRTALLSSCLGYLLPNPSMKRSRHV